MAEHTPGPWETNGTWVTEENDPGHNVGICICEPRPETRANARLIAAAPDLWAAGMASDTCLSLAYGWARKLGKDEEAKHILEVQQSLRSALKNAVG